MTAAYLTLSSPCPFIPLPISLSIRGGHLMVLEAKKLVYAAVSELGIVNFFLRLASKIINCHFANLPSSIQLKKVHEKSLLWKLHSYIDRSAGYVPELPHMQHIGACCA